MVVRGFNTNAETNIILDENDIPKMQFSKFMNQVVKEWHIGNKNNVEVKAVVKNLGVEF